MSTQHGNAEACELSAVGEQSHDLLKNIKFPDMHPPTEGAVAPAVQTTSDFLLLKIVAAYRIE
jgi:hypothetical protein